MIIKDIAVGEVEHSDDAVDHRAADRDQAVDQLLNEILHAPSQRVLFVASPDRDRSMAARVPVSDSGQIRCLSTIPRIAVVFNRNLAGISRAGGFSMIPIQSEKAADTDRAKTHSGSVINALSIFC